MAAMRSLDHWTHPPSRSMVPTTTTFHCDLYAAQVVLVVVVVVTVVIVLGTVVV